MSANKLSPSLSKDVFCFLNTHPPAEFGSRLRSMLLEYLRYEHKAGTYPLYLADLLWSLSDLFELLDTASREFPPPPP